MTRHRFWWPTLAAVLLSACSNLPHARKAGDNGDDTSADAASPSLLDKARYLLKAPRGGTPTLSELNTESSLGLRAVAPLTVPQDLWERIRFGFAMPDLVTEQVQDRELWYTVRPEYLERMTARSNKYLFHIVEELERRNMPTELALLPFVESAFNPQAVSSASAAGMWQFMPATGKDFDLKQNMFRDDRRDVLASTRAALDYLERLYRQFNDWHLALAAYNWGQGNVAKAIKRNQAQGLGTSYTELTMPMETRQYVPKLQAMKNIVARPHRFKVQLPAIGNHPFFDAVPIRRDMDVSKVAELAGVSEKDLRQLNPSINKPMFLAIANPSVLLPWDNAAQFETRLTTYDGPLASWTAWKAPSDMNVQQIANQHGVDAQELRELNKIPKRMLVKAGSTVLVPRHGKLNVDVPEELADHGQLTLKQEVVKKAARNANKATKSASNESKKSKAERPSTQVSVAKSGGHNKNSTPTSKEKTAKMAHDVPKVAANQKKH